jgi:hypothetical protein
VESGGDGSSFGTCRTGGGGRSGLLPTEKRRKGAGLAHRRRGRWRSGEALRVSGSTSPRPLRAAQARPRLPTQGAGFKRAVAGVPAPPSSAVATGPRGTPSSSSSWRPDDGPNAGSQRADDSDAPPKRGRGRPPKARGLNALPPASPRPRQARPRQASRYVHCLLFVAGLAALAEVASLRRAQRDGRATVKNENAARRSVVLRFRRLIT